jgi:hypothetical protein
MRRQMLSRTDLIAAVFIGGMSGVEIEHDIFRAHNPHAKVLPIASTGGAALNLARHYGYDQAAIDNIDFASIFNTQSIKMANKMSLRF